MPVAVDWSPFWAVLAAGLAAGLGVSMFTYILTSPVWRKKRPR